MIYKVAPTSANKYDLHSHRLINMAAPHHRFIDGLDCRQGEINSYQLQRSVKKMPE